MYLTGPGQWGCRVPSVRRGGGLPGVGHTQLRNGACKSLAGAGSSLRTTDDPSQSKDAENHGFVEEKQQAAWWSIHNPNILHHYSPHWKDWDRLSVPEAKTG